MKKHLITLITLAITFASTAQVPSYVPTNGLVGWWPFNGNAYDESGNGNNGTVNGATLTSDRFGAANKAYSFDGVNDFIEIMVNQHLSYTYSVWVNYVNFFQQNQLVFQHKDNCGRGGGPLFGLSVNQLRLIIENCGQCSPGACSSSIEYYNINQVVSNQWYHIVLSADEVTGEIKIYVNGAEVLSFTSSPSIHEFGVQPLTVGKWHDSPDIYFTNASKDDLGYWNRALTYCEIQDLYNAELNSLSVNGGPDQEVCEGQSTSLFGTGASAYSWSNNVVNGVGFVPTATSSYILTGTDANGCLGTDTVNVVVNSASFSSQTQSALDSFTWPVNGQTYTQSGTYSDTLANAAGCDSIVTLNLTMSYTGIEELNPTSSKKLLRITDLSGKETPFRKNTVLLFIYEDGTVERVYVSE